MQASFSSSNVNLKIVLITDLRSVSACSPANLFTLHSTTKSVNQFIFFWKDGSISNRVLVLSTYLSFFSDFIQIILLL